MSAISRGTKNTFRNPLRTLAITIILALSLGLGVVMLAALQTIEGRIESVKQSIGNTIAVSPAGARGFLGGGEPLTQAQVDGLKTLADVSAVDAIIDDQLRAGETTSLQSAMEAGTMGRRGMGAFGGTREGPVVMPIFAVGTSSASYAGPFLNSTLTIIDGQALDVGSDSDAAMVGTALAEKNGLKAGSTFTAYGTTITVSGVYDAGNHFANSAAVFPLKTLQRLSEQSGQVTSVLVRVDSITNLASVTTAVKDKLGTAADVVSGEDTSQQAVQPLENIRGIAMTSLLGALVAAAVITLLAMVLIVRERRKEIAVLKAIGAADRTIVTQFVSEAVVLTILGSIVGSVLGVVFSNPILNTLVTSSRGSGPGGGSGMRMAMGSFGGFQNALRDLQAAVSMDVVLWGLLVALGVAIVGSAVPAWFISKIRPAEVLRGE